LQRDRAPQASDYIGGEEWRKLREIYPRPSLKGGKNKEAVFPEEFYGTQLQRQIFPEDVANRAYVEYDTLPAYPGEVLHTIDEVEDIMNSGRVVDEEVNFWFNYSDMPDSGFPLKIECERLGEYEPTEYDIETNMNDVFTPFCPTVKDFPPAQDTLAVGQEMVGKVMGAHLQYGVLVDLGVNMGGLIPMYHDQGEKDIESTCFETLGMDKFEELFGAEVEVKVRVHALRFQQYSETNGGGHVYRFPVELELLEPTLEESVLKKPLDKDEGASRAPVVVRDPSKLELWQEMAQATGRNGVVDDPTFKQDLAEMNKEYEFSRKEQVDNISDAAIFDPTHDDTEKRKGAPDPLWGLKDIAPELLDENNW
jgi:hypothetical protein